MRPGDRITLDIEKAAAGGRMLARHNGRIVLVAGAIPGERVAVRIERVSSAVVFADTREVLTPSADRRPSIADPRCGGCVLAHVDYERQLQLKVDIVRDAFSRIARLPLTVTPAIVRSAEQGYRMRARLHVSRGRVGFYREGSHDICDAGATGQLAPATVAWLEALGERIGHTTLDGLMGVELAESVAGSERACHLELQPGVSADAFRELADGLTGLSAQHAADPLPALLAGRPVIEETFHPVAHDSAMSLTLRRDVRAFFQSNRFLVETLARHVAGVVPQGPVVDLYAGVGLFGLWLVAMGADEVTLVEGDPISGADLEANAGRLATRPRIERRSVESFVTSPAFRSVAQATVIVDPPRTGLSRDVVAALVRSKPSRLVYVSCDPATLARDARGLIDGGYELTGVTLFDMFPGTAHVEGVASFART